MSLREEIKDWQQPDKLVVPKSQRPGTEAPDTTGNGLHYYCLYLWLLIKRGEATPDDFHEFESVVSTCFARKGILHRSPTKIEEQTSKDDYISVMAVARVMNSKLAMVILDAGNQYHFGFMKWFYKNINPDYFQFFDLDLKNKQKKWYERIFHMETARAWFGKWPEVVTHLQWAAGVLPHFLRRLWQAIYLCVSTVDSASLVILNYLMIQTAKDQSALILEAGLIWEARMRKRWPNGMREPLALELSPDHPVVKYWID